MSCVSCIPTIADFTWAVIGTYDHCINETGGDKGILRWFHRWFYVNWRQYKRCVLNLQLKHGSVNWKLRAKKVNPKTTLTRSLCALPVFVLWWAF